MYRHFCPKCRAVYYSAAMSGATVPWICGICHHLMVHSIVLEEQVADEERVTIAGHLGKSPLPEEKKQGTKGVRPQNFKTPG